MFISLTYEKQDPCSMVIFHQYLHSHYEIYENIETNLINKTLVKKARALEIIPDV